MKPFSKFLVEAINTNDVNKAAHLIQKYLTKQLKTPFTKMPGVEHYHNSLEKGYGIRYFFQHIHSIRFNWATAGVGANSVNSVDYWNGTTHDPNFHLEFDHVTSLTKILPTIVDFLHHPGTGVMDAIPSDNLNEGCEYLTEMAMHSVFDAVLGELKPQEQVPITRIEQTLGSRGLKIINQLRADYSGMFEKQGRLIVFKGDVAELKKSRDAIVNSLGGVKVIVTAGGKGDTYSSTSGKDQVDSILATGIEKVAYKQQLLDLTGLIKLVVKGASNALFIAGRGGTGKALPNEAPVLTPTGWRRIDSLQVGDPVIAQDGSVCNVTGVFPQGLRETFNVVFADSRVVECDGDHLWEVNYYGWDSPQVLATKDIAEMRKARVWDSRFTVPLFSPAAIPDKILSIDPYLLGALLGDGCMSTKNSIGFTNNDPHIIEQVKSELPAGSELVGDGIEYRIRKSDTPGLIHPLNQELLKLGLKEVKSGSKFIPADYKSASIQQKIRLIQGLMDTDGYVDAGGSISYTTVSSTLADDFCEIIYSLGGKASKKLHSNHYIDKDGARIEAQPAYTITVGYKNPKDLFTLPRKLERVKEKQQYSSVQLAIQKIEPTGVSKECTCISIDHSRKLFVTSNYVCTHNTFTVEKVLADMGKTDGDGYFKNTGSASPVGIYKMLYKYRTQIIVFDDSDGALADQDGRNIFKAATDTKKIRKLVWNKDSKNMVDPDQMPEADDQGVVPETDMIPKHFEFTGKIIFISNLQIDKLDPDGALRTRALMVAINPTDTELFDQMEAILDTIDLEDGLFLTHDERMEVMVELRTNPKNVSLRKLCRGLNMRAALGQGEDWKRLVKLYA